MSVVVACPVCKATNTDASCRRCRADLSMLFALESQRSHLLAQAQACAQQADGDGIVHAAENAERLRSGPDARRWLVYGHLLRHDFVSARRYLL